MMPPDVKAIQSLFGEKHFNRQTLFSQNAKALRRFP
jgi:hypothetical protein